MRHFPAACLRLENSVGAYRLSPAACGLGALTRLQQYLGVNGRTVMQVPPRSIVVGSARPLRPIYSEDHFYAAQDGTCRAERGFPIGHRNLG
jgi:hypothetical protein